MRDGPTMLFVLLEAINPSTKVRTLALQSKIDTARVTDHGGDITNLLTYMESIRILSERKGAKITNYELRLFEALLDEKSIVNEEFRGMLQRKRDDWEQGHDITAADIIRTATTKYNNLVARKLPNGKNAWSASQAKSDKLMALTTQLTQLKQQLEDKKSGGGESGRGRGSNYGNGKGRSMVDEWRMKHDGDTKTVDGVEYVWCKKHIREGVYDGLYMKADTHPTHEAWQERKDNWKRRDKRDKSPAKGAASVPSDSKSGTGNLQLQQKLKSVLMTKKGMSQAEAQDIWASLQVN
jgi:hypothetical protein